MRAQAEIRAGVVWVNTPLMRELRAPFGGIKTLELAEMVENGAEIYSLRKKPYPFH